MIFIIIIAGLFRYWNAPVPRWYMHIFPIIFWSQAILFGLMHLFNYAGATRLALLPFIVPQLIGGMIWGYARIRYGWWANIAMHMAYNFIVVSGILIMKLNP